SKHPEWGAGQGVQYQLLERLPERSFQKPMRLEEYLRRLTIETRSSFERRLERLANTRPLPGFEKLVRESSDRLSSIGAVKRWALQNRISAAQLPNNGMFAYRAPKDYRF